MRRPINGQMKLQTPVLVIAFPRELRVQAEHPRARQQADSEQHAFVLKINLAEEYLSVRSQR